MDERELLRRFITESSQEAFAELVRLNAGMVYTAARRQLADKHLAEDVTQAVFILLARKAAHVKGTPASWLINATYFACQNSRKLAVRRQYHERRAAEMKGEPSQPQVEETSWETYAPVLDKALRRLNEKEREAVALRYFRGFSLKDVGASLGISEEAARKRVDRALLRLRGLMSVQIAVPAVVVLASHLSARATEAAPVKLVETIAASSVAGAKGTLAGTIAAKTAHAMTAIKIKIAAAIILSIGVAGVGTGAAIKLARDFQAATPVAPAPMPVSVVTAPSTPAPLSPTPVIQAIPPLIPETSVPGQIQMARWHVILTDQAANRVRAILKPVKSDSKFYQAMTGNSAEIRRIVAEAIATGGLVRASDDLAFAMNNSQLGNIPKSELAFGVDSQISLIMTDAKNSGGMLEVYSPSHDDHFVIADANRVHVNLNDPQLTIAFNEWVGRNLRLLAAPANTALMFQGDLSTGDALAMIGRYVTPSGRTALNHLIVWETFKAELDQNYTISEETSTQWWCVNGPQKLREWADAARAWAAQAQQQGQPSPSPPYAIERKLSDGKSIWLMQLARPAQWPGCWWDVQGHPANSLGGVPFHGDPPGGLWFYVELKGDARESALHEPNMPRPPISDQNNNLWYFADCHQEGDNTTRLVVGAPVGPWQEAARLTLNKSAIVDGIQFHVESWNPADPKMNVVNLFRKGILDNQYNLIAVDTSGKDVIADPIHFLNESWAVYRNVKNIEDRQDLYSFTSIKQGKLAYFKLMRRKREFVTFDGFATQPVVAPKTAVTSDEADLAEAEQKNRDIKTQIADSQKKRKAWAAIPPDPKKPQGFVRLLIDKADSGDEAGIRKLLVSHDPQMNKLLDAGSELFVINRSIRKKAVELFGAETIDEKFPEQPLVADMELPLMGQEWKPSADGESFQRPYDESMVMRKNADGSLYLDFDSAMKGMTKAQVLQIQLYISAVIAKGREVEKMLQGDKPPTLAEFSAVIQTTPPSPDN